MPEPTPGVNAALPEREYLRIKEVADHLGCGTGSVQNLIKKGALPAYRIAGTMWRIKRSDLEAVIIRAGGPE